ncbi:MAG: molybdopterin converting factor subunit 1 [Sandaracinus sp.]
MKVRVLYFAVARELAGTREEELELEAPATIAEARRAIERAHPALGARDARLRVAKNESFAGDAEPLADGDVLAILPPVAGG